MFGVTEIVLWDFDETLAERPGRWGGFMLEIIERQHPDCVADVQALREFYPWRSPEVVHEHLNEPGLVTAAIAPLVVDRCCHFEGLHWETA